MLPFLQVIKAVGADGAMFELHHEPKVLGYINHSNPISTTIKMSMAMNNKTIK